MSDKIKTALNCSNEGEFTTYMNKKDVLMQKPAEIQQPHIDIVDTLEVRQNNTTNIQTNIINLMQLLDANESEHILQESIIYNIFELIRHVCLHQSEDHEFLKLVKAWFHKYIISKKYSSLVKIYDSIFTDNLYCEENVKCMYIPEPSADWVKEKIKEYHEQIEHAQIRRNAKKPAPKYALNDIVGAKDKEGRWWMSKILNVHEFQGSFVYYVEFIGWGEKFNEFIADGFRLSPFNPKKHRYFRPAWNVSD